MKRISLYKRSTTIYFVLILSSFLSIQISNFNIKAYMILTIIFTFVYILKIKFSKLYTYEILWLLLYVYIMITAIYAIDIFIAIKIIFGELILVLSYFIIRFFLSKFSLQDFEIIFNKVGKIFIIISFTLYIVGILYIYYLNYTPSPNMYLNKYSIRVYGLYMEGTFPRLMGLAESPNNYFYFAFLFLSFYYYKKSWKLFLLTLVTLVLTFSGTGFVILFCAFLMLLLSNKKLLIPTLLLGLFILGIVYILYLYDDYINYLINYRIDRMLTGSGRFALWEYTINLISDSPFFGYGANQSRLILEGIGRDYQSAHNSFLDIFLTTGVVGILIYLFSHMILLISSYRLTIHYKTNIFIILYMSYFLISISNNTLHIDYLILYFSFLYIYTLHYVKMQHKQ